MIRVIELFAGIGAQAEALKEANIEHEVVAISEIDKYAIKAYELLHGPVNNLGDIGTFIFFQKRTYGLIHFHVQISRLLVQ